MSVLPAWKSWGSDPALEDGFAHPPDDTKPATYWYWISDNISREGITRDLEAMHRVGIGEAFISSVDVNPQERGPVKVLSDEWWKLTEHAVREGGRLGVDIGFFNCPGWSQSGGPWVGADQTMRYVVSSEKHVHGPTRFEEKLPAPSPHFQDIATLAFPAPAYDAETLGSHAPRLVSDPAQANVAALFDGDTQTPVALSKTPLVIDAETDGDFTARSLTIHGSAAPFAVTCELQATDAQGNFQTIHASRYDRHNPQENVGPMVFGPVVASFAPVTSRHFRFLLKDATGAGALTEIELSAAARLDAVVEKQLGKMFQSPQPVWNTYLWPNQPEPDLPDLAIPKDRLINLTDKLAPDGTLRWEVPPGDWIILRSGMAPTGVQNSPASPEGKGYEIDKMSRPLIGYHFDQYVGKLLARLPPEDRRAWKHVVMDSYEQGSQNWTDGLAADFQRRYGYDPLPYLPVFTGRLVDGADVSERFLWDLRRLVADRIAHDYVGGLRDASEKHGLKTWLENYGHWGFAGEFLQYGGESNDLGGEFWTGGDLGSVELRDASSAAHIYGKKVVSAESWTSGGPAWSLDPWALKKRGDWAATEGINHTVFHVYIQQPSERTPGISAPFGTEFNRHNTWFSQMGDWITYLRRNSFLLQQGHYVADVAYFIGEDAPKMTGVRQPALPPGYSFDYINAEAIEQRLSVKDGRFVLPDGMSYHVLVLPPQDTMRPECLRKIRDLVAAGGVVVGTPPLRSPSLESYPACDREVTQLSAELWKDCDGQTNTTAKFGQGQVFRGVELPAVFARLGIAPDVADVPAGSALPWIHRASGDANLYFLSNQTDAPVSVAPAFRVAGRQPELWDSVTGERRDLPDFSSEGQQTKVPLQLSPRQSLFVVFRRSAEARSDPRGTANNFPPFSDLGELLGPWSVRFDPNWGGPEQITFAQLQDWTTRPEEGIRHYSGTAVYQRDFDVPETAVPNKELYLELGTVRSLARVRVNGHDCGLAWCAPWRVEITNAAKTGRNQLEIEVVNPWANRIIGDQKLPAEKRFTAETLPVLRAESPLLPAGLIGPVTLLSR